jgi:hypothetical protein
MRTAGSTWALLETTPFILSTSSVAASFFVPDSDAAADRRRPRQVRPQDQRINPATSPAAFVRSDLISASAAAGLAPLAALRLIKRVGLAASIAGLLHPPIGAAVSRLPAELAAPLLRTAELPAPLLLRRPGKLPTTLLLWPAELLGRPRELSAALLSSELP